MYELERIANFLSERRERLGMSDYHIAALSKVSQPTIYRFLSGKSYNISAANLVRIAQALGSDIGPDLHETFPPEEFREKRAAYKAQKIIEATAATSALENQNISDEDRKAMMRRIKHKLLAGSPKDLWSE